MLTLFLHYLLFLEIKHNLGNGQPSHFLVSKRKAQGFQSCNVDYFMSASYILAKLSISPEKTFFKTYFAIKYGFRFP